MSTIVQMKTKLKNILDTKLSIGEQSLTEDQQKKTLGSLGIWDKIVDYGNNIEELFQKVTELFTYKRDSTKKIEDLSSSKLNLSGGVMSGLITGISGNKKGIKLNACYITSCDPDNGEIALQGGHLRFGDSDWDYNKWAGLKYNPTNKTIYIGLADGTIFRTNNSQSGGSLFLPGVSSAYIGNGQHRILDQSNYTTYCATTNHIHSNAAYSSNGFLSADDKLILDVLKSMINLQTKTAYNATWLMVFYQNTSSGGYFNTTNVKYNINPNLYSVLILLANINNGVGRSNYEFLLEYPAVSSSLYNRWSQTNDPVTSSNVSGYSAIHIDWSGDNWGGMALSSSSSSCFIDGIPSTSDWWYAIGTYSAYSGGMPGPVPTGQSGSNGKVTNQCKLWLRIK